MRKAHIAIAAFALFLAACKMGPHYERPEQNEPEDFRFDTENQDTIVNIRWWTLFDDPQIDTLVAIALRENQDVMIAVYRIEQARAQLGIQKGEYGPKFNLVGQVNTGNLQSAMATGSDARIDVAVGAVSMNWEIDIWGKYRRLTGSARASLMAEEYNMRAVQISLISDVIQTYFQLLDFRSRLEISQETIESRQTSLDIIQARFNVGIVAEIDLNQSQIQLAIAQTAVPLYKRQIVFTENRLSLLLGRAPNAIPEGKKLEDEVRPLDLPTGMPMDLLLRRPDVAASEQDLVAQSEMIGVAQAQRMPALSLTGLLGVGGTDFSAFNTATLWQGGAQLLGPLFHWQQNKRRVDIERAATEEAAHEYRKVVLNAFREVDDAITSISTLKDEIVASESRVVAAKNGERLSTERYDKGVTSYLEVLESQRQAFDAQLKLSQGRQELLSSYIILYKALGGGWLSEEEEKAAQEEEQDN